MRAVSCVISSHLNEMIQIETIADNVHAVCESTLTACKYRCESKV